MSKNATTNRIGARIRLRLGSLPWIAFAVCAAALQPRAAPAADELKPLRHLVFKVGILTTTRLEVRRSGIGMPGHPVSGGNSDTYNAGVQAMGSITADVIAATSDQGLVVDVSEDAQTRKGPRVRVGVYPNGRLVYDQTQTVTEEEEVLLRLLARGLIDANLAPGASFTVKNEAKQQREYMTFHVSGTDERGRLKLDVDGATKLGGPQPYDGTVHGKLVYDQAKTVPVLVQLMTRTHRETISELNTTDTQIDIDLVEDSFSSKS